MAENKNKKGAAAEKKEEKGVVAEIISDKLIDDKAVQAALAEIDKEKDERKKKAAKKALCIATYFNRKTRLQLLQRRAEDEITKEKLDASKKLLERLIGFETEIKDGILVPTDKKIPAEERLTSTQLEDETRKLNSETDKKFRDAEQDFTKAVRELRDSYEGEYRWYLNEW
jgi:hypothetical protein